MDVPILIRQAAIEEGIAEDSIDFHSCPREATEVTLKEARPGDLLVLLALTQRSEALALIHEFMGENG